MDDLEIITTSDGSHTLRNKQLDETYHSIHGAMRESMHVFIKNGLEYNAENKRAKNISILEVGFGTGLNALLTLRYAIQHRLPIRYTTLEPFPLGEDVWSKLNYADTDKDKQQFRTLHAGAWGSEIVFNSEFTLLKLNTSLQEARLNDVYDVIYFDAFAPAVQPELWAFEALKNVTSLLKPAGVFVTYSAKGQLKRDLKSLGLKVETLPGPQGKKEMVRAERLS